MKEYTENELKKCECCGNTIPIGSMKPSEYQVRKYCSSQCAAKMNNSMHPKRTRKKYYCVYCGKEVGRGGKYCSSLCKQNYEQDIYIQKWKNGEVSGLSGEYNISKRIRRYLMEKYDYKCCQCGWGERNPYTNLIPLEVDHIDGDHTNNLEDNLRLLCPNCHQLTPTYRALNIGSGRKARKKYT